MSGDLFAVRGRRGHGDKPPIPQWVKGFAVPAFLYVSSPQTFMRGQNESLASFPASPHCLPAVSSMRGRIFLTYSYGYELCPRVPAVPADFRHGSANTRSRGLAALGFDLSLQPIKGASPYKLNPVSLPWRPCVRSRSTPTSSGRAVTLHALPRS